MIEPPPGVSTFSEWMRLHYGEELNTMRWIRARFFSEKKLYNQFWKSDSILELFKQFTGVYSMFRHPGTCVAKKILGFGVIPVILFIFSIADINRTKREFLYSFAACFAFGSLASLTLTGLIIVCGPL